MWVRCGSLRVCVFVKKKPAYGLRISDWSSDVCSSDLARQVVGKDFTDRVQQAARHALALQLCQLGVYLHQFRLQEIERHDQEHARSAGRIDNAQGGEIGSVSCRERVSQYGYISVEPVPLK